MYVPLNPIPSKILSIGPPKHAESAIRGYPMRATVTFATKSPRELPTAKIVKPRIASLKRKMWPIVYATKSADFYFTCNCEKTYLKYANDLIHNCKNPNDRNEEANYAECQDSCDVIGVLEEQ